MVLSIQLEINRPSTRYACSGSNEIPNKDFFAERSRGVRYNIYMYLFIGLGNPGVEYHNNRHNAGFMFVDFLANKTNASPFKFDKYTNSELSTSSDILRTSDFGLRTIILVKPQTFMNRSGESVRKYFQSHKKLAISHELFVAHDDLDIPLGKFKIQKGVGPKMHNGIESIEKAIGTKDFYRIRIGVENRGENKIPGETYVLQNFNNNEIQSIPDVFDNIYKNLNLYFGLQSS